MSKFLLLLFSVLSYLNTTAQLVVGNNILPFDPALSPFYHGVASGDPLDSSVILWTRVTPQQDTIIKVSWKIASDPQFKNIITKGVTFTSKNRDYTVKVDATGLMPSQTYYYYFTALNKNSSIGRTRTAPLDKVDHLRFGVVSAADYEAGYFNVYGNLAKRKDLDAIIHLGDYINEYGENDGSRDYKTSVRLNIPNKELVNLFDYRTRYSLYRLDPDLQHAHKQHPFIAVWDDHEFAYRAYTNGSENHNKNEGNWNTRKMHSKKAFYEWMPIRETKENSIYRRLHYGNLADLIMLDTRLEGRQKQLLSVNDAKLKSSKRTMLGHTQKKWLINELKSSKAKWKIIGSQVQFAPLSFDRNSADTSDLENHEANQLLDRWDGYPAERDEIINVIDKNKISNTLVLSGNSGRTFASNIPFNKTNDYLTFAGVEFCTPSISSKQEVHKAIDHHYIYTTNPHIQYSESNIHGYIILDLSQDAAQADWHYLSTVEKPDYRNHTLEHTFYTGWKTNSNQNNLYKTYRESALKTTQQALAPSRSPAFERNKNLYSKLSEVFSIDQHKSGISHKLYVQYASYKTQLLTLDIYDSKGFKLTDSIYQEISSGINLSELPLPKLKKGNYTFKVHTADTQHTQQITIY
jgi:alkaline phosphatase D